MEVYEMPITLEEARNYHKVIYQLKMLSPVEWIKTYIYTVIFSLIFLFILTITFVVYLYYLHFQRILHLQCGFQPVL